MPTTSLLHTIAVRRLHRARTKLAQNQETPRLSVHRSLRHISAQVIDDKTGRTLASANDIAAPAGASKTERATIVGKAIAEAALAAGVTAVRFDRGASRYHGRVAALADASRAAGLKF